MEGTRYSRRSSAFERLTRRRPCLSRRWNEAMNTHALRDLVRTPDGWRGTETHRVGHRAAAAASFRALLLAGALLLLGWGSSTPAHALSGIIDSPTPGPITVGAGETLEIVTGGAVTSATAGVIVNAGGELIISGGSVSSSSTSSGDYVVEVNGGKATISGGTLRGLYSA